MSRPSVRAAATKPPNAWALPGLAAAGQSPGGRRAPSRSAVGHRGAGSPAEHCRARTATAAAGPRSRHSSGTGSRHDAEAGRGRAIGAGGDATRARPPKAREESGCDASVVSDASIPRHAPSAGGSLGLCAVGEPPADGEAGSANPHALPCGHTPRPRGAGNW